MSGGMDIDWSARERAIRRALAMVGDKTREEIEACADMFWSKTQELSAKIRVLEECLQLVNHAHEDLTRLLHAHPSEIEAAKKGHER